MARDTDKALKYTAMQRLISTPYGPVYVQMLTCANCGADDAHWVRVTDASLPLCANCAPRAEEIWQAALDEVEREQRSGGDGA